MSGRKPRPLVDRIRAGVIVTDDGCWEWQARRTKGYGRIWIGSRTDGTRSQAYAHRVAYECLVGPIPEGLFLDHLCRNPPCCNPEHLEPVTNRENLLRGAGPIAQQAKQTHCKRGHELTSENTWVGRDRKRYCRECHRMRESARKKRLREADGLLDG